VLLGEPSGDLVDCDLDSTEAIALAPFLLPDTGRVSGRASRARSHWWYRARAVRPEKFCDINHECLVELRSVGQQTVVPPSIYPSGERVVWYSKKSSVRINGSELHSAISKLAAATLIARHWPREPGQRQDISLALAGILLRAEWSEQEAVDFVCQVSKAAGDPEWNLNRKTVASTTRKRLDSDRPATGRPRLAELLGTSPAGTSPSSPWRGVTKLPKSLQPNQPCRPH
jgi:Bifunctional DNA primase/polymerase, N-terminal